MKVPFIQTEGGNLSLVALNQNTFLVIADGLYYLVDNPLDPGEGKVARTVDYEPELMFGQVAYRVEQVTGVKHSEPMLTQEEIQMILAHRAKQVAKYAKPKLIIPEG